MKAKVLFADELDKMLMDKDHDSLIGRMIWLEGRHAKTKDTNNLFPAFLESGYLSNKHGKTWLVAVVQRSGGTIGMVKIRIVEEDLNGKYRVWDIKPDQKARLAWPWKPEESKEEPEASSDKEEPKQNNDKEGVS